ncbi:hypothetical protein LCGC14_2674830 [marine sediment metagenome]|uniref:Uncharacterized protein n=1 Tax=marine sediment metagenome TaxID=412755 RepID=A0A0F9BXX8_9ZZZZ
MYWKEEEMEQRMKVPECKKGKYLTIKPLDLVKVNVLRKFLKELEDEVSIRCGTKEISFTTDKDDPYWWNREQ